MQNERFYQRFQYQLDGVSCELTLDKGGLTVARGDEESELVLWDDVRTIEHTPSIPRVRIVTEGDAQSITIPFDVSGKDGGFDELMETVLDHVKRVSARAELPSTFGRWKTWRIALWLVLGLTGAAAALALTPAEAHWIVGAAVAALWLMAVWYGGLAREHLLVVESERVVLKRVVASRSYRLSEVSDLKVKLFGGALSALRVGLLISARTGESMELPDLGAETYEAFFAVRQAFSK